MLDDPTTTPPPAPERTDEVPMLPPSPPGPNFAEKAWGYAKELLVIAVIPGFLWVVKLERDNATRDVNLVKMQEDIGELKAEAGKLDDQVRIAQNTTEIRAKISENAISIVRIEGKIDRIDAAVARIEKLVE